MYRREKKGRRGTKRNKKKTDRRKKADRQQEMQGRERNPSQLWERPVVSCTSSGNEFEGFLGNGLF